MMRILAAFCCLFLTGHMATSEKGETAGSRYQKTRTGEGADSLSPLSRLMLAYHRGEVRTGQGGTWGTVATGPVAGHWVQGVAWAPVPWWTRQPRYGYPGFAHPMGNEVGLRPYVYQGGPCQTGWGNCGRRYGYRRVETYPETCYDVHVPRRFSNYPGRSIQ